MRDFEPGYEQRTVDRNQYFGQQYANMPLPGRVLAAARRLTGMRQAEAAEKGGFSVSMLKMLERHGSIHAAPHCKSLRSYLNVLRAQGVHLEVGNGEITLRQHII